MWLIVIVTMMAGSVDGGVSVRIENLGEFAPAACQIAAQQIEAKGTFSTWQFGDRKGGTVTAKAICVSRK